MRIHVAIAHRLTQNDALFFLEKDKALSQKQPFFCTNF